MVKQVPKSERIQALVAKSVGDPEVNLDNLAIYEAVMANTTPLRRRNGLYAGGVLGQDTLSELVSKINGPDHIPLQLMHRSGIPVGKVFHAEMKPTRDGGTEARALFYLPKQDSQYVNKIDTGVINDVSVGFLPKALQCSSCGFDYMGDKATFANVYDCVCDQGHKIGVDGVHARIHGVAAFQELSLVDQGASVGAVIMPRQQQSLGTAPNMARFAAEGIDERAFFLFASNADFTQLNQEDPPMADPNIEKLIETSAKLMMAERDLVAAQAALAAAVAPKDAEIVRLTAELKATAEALTLAKGADVAKLTADLKLAMELINEFGAALLTASGKTEALPETVSEAVTVIRDARAKLALSVLPGGKSVPAASGSKGSEHEANPSFTSFKRS